MSEFYPPADRKTQWFEDNFPGTRMNINVGLWHTTEGTTWPGYEGGATAPNLTARPNIKGERMEWRQHFRVNTSSRALRNASGGVETNTLNVCQIELVGTCDPAHRRRWGTRTAGEDYLYWPDAPTWALAGLSAFVRWMFTEQGVPLTCPPRSAWVPYPDSANPAKWARFGAGRWRTFTGWCGHQHAPENVHGDPGDMDVPSVILLARKSLGQPDDDDNVPMVVVREGEGLRELAQRIGSTTEQVRVANLARFGGPLREGERLRRP